MGENLEKLIEQRKIEAESRNIERKATEIAKYLGGGRDVHDVDIVSTTNGYEADFETLDGALKIQASFEMLEGSDGGLPYSHTLVTYKGKTVFEESGLRTVSYIPGERCKSGNWEKLLNRLYSTASKAERKMNKRRSKLDRENRQKANEEVKAKWGLK